MGEPPPQGLGGIGNAKRSKLLFRMVQFHHGRGALALVIFGIERSYGITRQPRAIDGGDRPGNQILSSNPLQVPDEVQLHKTAQ